MVEELGAMETIQADFLSNISHEFKTPITAIEGYSTLLQNAKDEKEQALYVEKITLNTKRLSTLVGDVLLLAKLDNQSIQPKRNKFMLDEQIRQVILMQEIKWTERNIQLDVDMDEIEFYGTETSLSHVWLNLFSNAIKFSPDGGLITIKLNTDEKNIYFTISDEGAGINKGEEKRIFDKFYQGESDKKSEGCGLGLALAKRIIDINNGEIFVKNNLEKGCTFTVKLQKTSVKGEC
jgi:signal transduction histidine kinase